MEKMGRAMLLLAGVILFISYYQLYMLEFLVELMEIKTPRVTPFQGSACSDSRT